MRLPSKSRIFFLTALLALAGSTAGAAPVDRAPPGAWYMRNSGEPFLHGPSKGKPGLAHADIHLLEAWEILDSAPDVPVAVIDVDFDVRDPRLTGAFRVAQGMDYTGSNWTKFYYGDVHHGTMSAGLIGAGAAVEYSGISKKSWLIPFNLSAEEDSADALERAFRQAVDSGARVINCSCGMLQFSPEGVQRVKAALSYARQKDVLVVASAGNDGISLDEHPLYPASFADELDNVVSVGASDRRDERISLSNYSKKYVDVFAPGDEILILTPHGTLFSSGTSEAAPIVAGIAALVRQLNPRLSAALVKDVLLEASDKNENLRRFSRSGGRVNAYAALRAAGGMAPGAAQGAKRPPSP